MAMSNDNFSDQIARLQQERRADQWEAKKQEATDEAEYIGSLQTQIRDYMRAGDKESAKNLLGELETSQARYSQLAHELQPPQSGLSEAKMQFLSKYSDSLGRAHWSQCGATQLQAFAHAHDTALRHGLVEDSPEYFQMIERLAPAQQSGDSLTPDEVVGMVRNSKYGADFTGRQYNRAVKKIYEGR
jgi:hypothetical protein